MGLRSRIKSKLIQLKERFTGEYSAAAPPPESVIHYKAPGHPVDDVNVTMARLQKPVATPGQDPSSRG